MSEAPISPVRVVLLRPRDAQNLGAIARALKNFGVRDWVVVEPQADDLATARRVAVQSEDVLDQRREAASLDEAVADCVWVVGTSSRSVPGKRKLDPHQVGRELVERGRQGPVALVFGDERSGLHNSEILRCHDLSSVPTDPAQPSINLAQAALLYLYEYRMALLASRDAPAPRLPRAASDGQLAQLQDVLETTLDEGGFLRGPHRHAVRDLLAPLRRARLTAQEAGLWSAALHVLRKRLTGSRR